MTDNETRSGAAESPEPDRPGDRGDMRMDAVAGTADAGPDTAADGGTPDARSARPAAKRRRRRWVWALSSAVVLLIVADLGGGWYFSGQLLVPDHSVTYGVTVEAVNGAEVTLTRDDTTVRPAIMGLIWADGSATVDATVGRTNGDIVRHVTAVQRGDLRPGLRVRMEVQLFVTDPGEARGLDFSVVSVPGELGDMPAWLVPPTTAPPRTTWVIGVHGYGSSRREALRILPTLAASGLPTLVIGYRNDTDAPASPDGFTHLGDSEWKDLMAAIGYARDHGATGVVLYGWSMGGAIVLTSLHRMPPADTGFVRAVVLDSPAVDWTATVNLAGDQMHLPRLLTWTAERISELRAGISFARLDQRRYESALTVPTLMFVDLADTTVPPGPSLQFAHDRADLVTLVTTNGGDHTGSWNTNPDAYENAVRTFLTRIG